MQNSMPSFEMPHASKDNSSQEHVFAFEAMEKLKNLHHWRDISLSDLQTLAEARAVQKGFSHSDLELLRFIESQGFLDDSAQEDVDAVCRSNVEIEQMAREMIAYISQLDDAIAYLEQGTGFSAEEVEQRKTVRRQLLLAHEREWGVN